MSPPVWRFTACKQLGARWGLAGDPWIWMAPGRLPRLLFLNGNHLAPVFCHGERVLSPLPLQKPQKVRACRGRG